ncbi:MAG: alpha/beta hydrolase [Anaerolineales bacterium]|nr:alpha/beta hydrolase [Anaerolineales bacterium]
MILQLNEFRMSYEDAGAGTPVLLIHGYPLNRQMWQPQVESLSDCARLIAPDLRGHGDSEDAEGAYTMEAHAQDLSELLYRLGIAQNVILCGLSMGGYIALAFHRLFPHRVGGLVLASTRAAADSPEARVNREGSIRLAQEKGIRFIAESMASRLLSGPTVQARPQLIGELVDLMSHNSLRAVLGDLSGMKVRSDSLPGLPGIRVPVLIIHGVEDAIVPLSEAEQMQSLIPQAQLCAIPQAAHLPNLEQTATFNHCLRAFLKQF